MKVFVFDSKKCNGCHNCQVGCKDEHVGNDWYPYAKAQPNTGQFWLRVKQTEHGQVPLVSVEYKTWLCMHCEECIAAKDCPESAFIRRDDGLTYIDLTRCNGCRACITKCPYDAVFYNKKENIAQKCTGCAHLVDKGEIPHCVDLCATGALRFGDYESFEKELEQAEVMLPESGTKPQVYYLNLPHLFIGGEVWDPNADEVIEGAVVKLTLPNGEILQQQTDDFGDFVFTGLKKGSYDLEIAAIGFLPNTKTEIELSKSLYLGDFPLELLSHSCSI